MAATLLGAVFDLYGATSDLVAYDPATARDPGSPYLDEAPEKKDFPHVVVEHLGERPTEESFENDYIEEGVIRLTAYATTTAQAEAICGKIKDAFDRNFLTIANTSHQRTFREEYMVKRDPKRSQGNRVIYAASVLYRFRLKRTYTVPS